MIKDIKITLYVNYKIRLKYNLYIFILDDPSSKDNSENEIQKEEEDSSEEQDIEDEWKINPKDEKIFWCKELLYKYIYIPKLCSKCKKDTFLINEKNSRFIKSIIFKLFK